MLKSDYHDSVFINCPFDSDYKPLLDAIVFAVFDCGFIARCALEEEDASLIRKKSIILFLIVSMGFMTYLKRNWMKTMAYQGLICL